MSNLYESLVEVLKQDDRFFTASGDILRNAIYEAAMQPDAKLLHLLLNNRELKGHFFTEVDGITIFDKVKFGWVINNRQFLPDSYTRFLNKIGLADENEYLISASGKVNLVFPYKDCVLEGGQTKEDQKRSEVFYNTTLAPDEIDRLLYPKVLVGAKRYSYDGNMDLTGAPVGDGSVSCVPTTDFSDTDNLVIKGNNLLALTSLRKQYEGKIKCIYIDPPYYYTAKKDEDTFEYNSNFKLSSWLVFMKNRLEIARKLLREDGAIFVQINDDGVAELHRLLKDIFCTNSENNFINKITVKTKSPSGFSSVNPGVFKAAEYILVFAKNKKSWKYTPQFVKTEYDTNYKWYIPNIAAACSEWTTVDLFEHVANKQGYESCESAIESLGAVGFNSIVGDFALENADSVYRLTAIGNDAGQSVVAAREESRLDENAILCVKRDNHYDVYITKGQEIAFYSKKVRVIDGERVPSMQLTNIWTDTPYEGIAREGDVTLKGGKKPEKLIRRIIEMSTAPGDIVLDYHLGSGTTCAVAHKLKRQYIGVEQMDVQIKKILHRLPTVIGGEQSGISKILNWRGGGSFVYCELAKLNQSFADEIESADSADVLAEIYERITDTGFISCKVKPKGIDSAADDFCALSLDDQKRFLMELLDKNLLYVNTCDIDDAEFGISDEDRAFTKSFYHEV